MVGDFYNKRAIFVCLICDYSEVYGKMFRISNPPVVVQWLHGAVGVSVVLVKHLDERWENTTH